MRLFLLCLTLAATQAAAGDFEGIVTGRQIGDTHSENTMKMYISSIGVRTEATGTGPQSFNIIVLWQPSEPGYSYVLNPATMTYLKQDNSKLQSTAGAAELPKVERLGTGSYIGHTVQKVKVTSSDGKSQELWIDTSLHFPAAALALFGQMRGARANPWKALENAGVLGIPLRDINANGGWEATSVEKKSLAASLFQIPAGYHQAKSGIELLPPAQQAQFKAQLDAMTPEQRARVEEMMKKAAE